jgi:glycosyltransferase involved in cell wall biosynthesis
MRGPVARRPRERPSRRQRSAAGAPRRVAVVVPSLTSGGAERVAETLAREFARTAQVTVVTMEPRLTAAELRQLPVLPWADRLPAGCRQVHLPSSGAGLSRLGPLVVRFAALARRERFDVVYSFLTWTNVLVAAARLLGGRYGHIASEHALAESLRSDGGQLAWLARVLPLVYRLPDWLVVVSDAARSSLLAAGVLPRPERAITIPNPVDVAGIVQLAKAPVKPFAPAGRPTIVCVARLHGQKDHRTLLRAMTLVPCSYLLALAGDGPLRGELQEMATRLGLQDRVFFLGAVPNPYPLMRSADVVVLPSTEEGFGLVAVEAAALGVPFVGSDVGGLREVCDLLGHDTFPPGDHVALAAALVDAVSHPPRSAPTEAALSRYAPNRIAEIYLGLASRQPGVPALRTAPA